MFIYTLNKFDTPDSNMLTVNFSSMATKVIKKLTPHNHRNYLVTKKMKSTLLH